MDLTAGFLKMASEAYWEKFKRKNGNVVGFGKKYYIDKGDSIEHKGHTLYRIVALKSVGNAVKGEKGGYVEDLGNLSQTGRCWIYNDAKVYGSATLADDAHMDGNAEVYGNSFVGGHVVLRGNAEVYGGSSVVDNVRISGNVKVGGGVELEGNFSLCGDAVIESDKDYIVFRNNFSSFRNFTWTRSDNMWKVGCFHGTGEELVEKAFMDGEQKGLAYKAYVDLVGNLLEIEKKGLQSC